MTNIDVDNSNSISSNNIVCSETNNKDSITNEVNSTNSIINQAKNNNSKNGSKNVERSSLPV